MHPINFVFDVDDTLVLHFEKSEWRKSTQEIVDLYGEDFFKNTPFGLLIILISFFPEYQLYGVGCMAWGIVSHCSVPLSPSAMKSWQTI